MFFLFSITVNPLRNAVTEAYIVIWFVMFHCQTIDNQIVFIIVRDNLGQLDKHRLISNIINTQPASIDVPVNLLAQHTRKGTVL